MPITTGFEFGDVVLVPFPFSDQSTSKKRPAVVVSSSAYHQARPDVIIMAITSQVSNVSPFGEHFIRDWKAAGLLKASVLKPVLTTLATQLVIKKLGQFQSFDRDTLQGLLDSILGSRSRI